MSGVLVLMMRPVGVCSFQVNLAGLGEDESEMTKLQ